MEPSTRAWLPQNPQKQSCGCSSLTASAPAAADRGETLRSLGREVPASTPSRARFFVSGRQRSRKQRSCSRSWYLLLLGLCMPEPGYNFGVVKIAI